MESPELERSTLSVQTCPHCRSLLPQHESNGHEHLDSDRLIIQVSRLVFPLFQGIQGRLVEKGRAGNDLHLDHVALRIQDGVNLHLSFQM